MLGEADTVKRVWLVRLAEVAELVDARALRALGRYLPCGFESLPRHHVKRGSRVGRGTPAKQALKDKRAHGLHVEKLVGV